MTAVVQCALGMFNLYDEENDELTRTTTIEKDNERRAIYEKDGEIHNKMYHNIKAILLFS